MRKLSYKFMTLMTGCSVSLCTANICSPAIARSNSRSENPTVLSETREELAVRQSGNPRSQMKPLDGAEIARALTGKQIEPDPNVSQAAFRFSEEFHADGVWISRREQRALVTETGRWAVQGNQICVTANSKPPQCREVWGDVSLRRIAIADRGSVSIRSVQILMKVENIN